MRELIGATLNCIRKILKTHNKHDGLCFKFKSNTCFHLHILLGIEEFKMSFATLNKIKDKLSEAYYEESFDLIHFHYCILIFAFNLF